MTKLASGSTFHGAARTTNPQKQAQGVGALRRTGQGTRELLGWHLSRSSKAEMATSAMEPSIPAALGQRPGLHQPQPWAIRTLREQCAHRHRFETLLHASRVIGDRIGFYNTRRPHQARVMKTPAEAFAFAALPVQISMGHYTAKA
jgi:transposase InsO family protein